MAQQRSGLHWRDLLLLVPFLAMLIPNFYAKKDPVIWGFPFFYWYQFVWIICGSLLTGVVFWLRRRGQKTRQ